MSELKPGTAFNLPTPPNGEHYFFVLLGPTDAGELIIVNVDTIKNDVPFDKTTVLRPGRHVPRFIKKKSYVNFHRATLITIAELRQRLDASTYTAFSSIDATLLETLQQGLLASGRTPRRVKTAAKRLLDPPS